MARKPLTDAEIIASLPAARERARQAAQEEPRAELAYYDALRRRIVVELAGGAMFAFPAEVVEELAGASDEVRAGVEVLAGGEVLRWAAVDADVAVPGLIARVANVRAWAARYLGAGRSEAKAAAARANGRKGGRPRKQGAAG
ncbi:MAG TPA: DUF2442 domain-containing protein [Longimicrobium sp.]|nr:DUF2442 domain-containing protein [Longimicrobium sp.]